MSAHRPQATGPRGPGMLRRRWDRWRPTIALVLTAVVIGVTLPRLVLADAPDELAAAGLLLVVGGYAVWRLHRPRRPRPPAAPGPPPGPSGPPPDQP